MTARRVRHRYWLQRLPPFTRDDPLAGLAGSILWSLALFAIGLAISFAAGFSSLFLRTPASYLGPLGVFVVSFAVHWGTTHLPAALHEAASCFEDQRNAASIVERRLQNMYRFGPTAIGILVWQVVALALAISFAANRDLLSAGGLDGAFERSWFEDPSLAAKFLLLVTYGVPVAALLIGPGYGLLQNLVLISELSRENLRPIVPYVIPRLRSLVNFYTLGAIQWSVGVLLFVLLFSNHPGVLAVLIVFITAIMGIALVLLPHVSFHESLVRMERKLTSELADEATGLLKSKDPVERLSAYEAIRAAPGATWLYDLGGYFSLLVSQLPALAYVSFRAFVNA